MSVDEETTPETPPAKPVRKWRRRLRRAAISFVVILALLVGGLTYAFKVSGLEISTPNGVNVIIARKPLHGRPIGPADDVVYERLHELAEAHPDDFGYPGWDPDEQVIHVNIATDHGQELYDALTLPAHPSPMVVRTGAVSVVQFGEIGSHDFNGVHAGSYDSVHGRVILFSDSVRPSLLNEIKDLFGPDAVAVLWEPWRQPDHFA